MLVTREMTLVTPPRLLLLVDTHRCDGTPKERADIERCIAMAASLASHALDAGMMVGLYAWSDDWVSIKPNRGKRHARDVLTALARLSANTTHRADRLMDAAGEMIKSGTTPVLFTPRELQAGISEHGRGGTVVLSTASAAAVAMFDFDPELDFANAGPLEE